MPNDLFTKIKSLENNSAGKQKMLARYFLSHFQDLPFQTAAKIAKKAGVSEPTVIRCAKALGYEGFPELRDELQRMILGKLAPFERLHQAVVENYDLENIIAVGFETEIRNLREAQKHLDPFKIEQIVNYIIEAKKKYVLGLRTSAGCAYILGRLLTYVLSDVITILNDGISVFEELRAIRKGDILIALSYPRYIKTTVTALEFARDREASTITISDSKLAPAAQVSEFSIIAPSSFISFTRSYTACLSIINLLVTLIAHKGKARSEAMLQEWENTLKSFDFFYR